ncbi:hypothetical protein Aspvir_002885 [Aspergillus viridinutans]|uniref:Uncharacterized protein n=1 Tax=Aspergillus viridinutans TaxID=75553 RepID=A0A9P3FA11_ASPVI|nr:uncharacterized protein Aspvir_002885 [Aspergillus viridinutans]GIK07228.1 hypothetical protein Aspvir_002885 [Aspergillus viridinutans]
MPGLGHSGCAHIVVSLGGVIVASRRDGHCASDTFKTELNLCMDCALKYEVWQYYVDSVSKAGTACGLEANPVELASAVAGTTSTTSETGVADQERVEEA